MKPDISLKYYFIQDTPDNSFFQEKIIKNQNEKDFDFLNSFLSTPYFMKELTDLADDVMK